MYDGIWLENVIKHVEKIAKKAHPTGSISNRDVRRYLVNTLNAMGAKVTLQRTTGYNPNHRITAPIVNIVAEFPAKENNTRKKLMLMSHYDSAKPFAKGAGDAGSGIAVVLEVLRGYLKQEAQRKNDIVVLFTDGEELGLLGAHAFVDQHHLADTIGLILNFEARGSSGPVIMWPESTSGTAALVNTYQSTNPPFPVSSSLIYDLYQLLPNDTDMTVFKQKKDIQGLNFAFIDDHFNYHTEQDDLKHLSYNSLMHQALQLKALLPTLANTDLEQLSSNHDSIYFTVPGFGLLVWPDWSGSLLMALTWLLALLTFSTNTEPKKGLLLLKSGGVFIFIMLVAWIATKGFLWLIYNMFKPELNDILQGFPYWGHEYMLVCWLLILSLTMGLMGNLIKRVNGSIAWVPALTWSLVFTFVAIKIPGSSYLLLPAVFSWLYLMLSNHIPKIHSYVSIFATLALLPIAILLTLLPVAMGLKMIWAPALLLTWLVTLFAPMATQQTKWKTLILLSLPLGLFSLTINKDQFSIDSKRPTSLSYLYDIDEQHGWFLSMDKQLTEWNKVFFTNTNDQMDQQTFYENYRQAVRHINKQDLEVPLNAAKISEVVDLLNHDPVKKHISYEGNQYTNQVHFYSNTDITINKLSINGRYLINETPVKIQSGARFLLYHLDGKKTLDMQIELDEGNIFDWQIQSIGFNLLHQPELDIPPRPIEQMPKPSVLTDSITTVQRFVAD